MNYLFIVWFVSCDCIVLLPNTYWLKAVSFSNLSRSDFFMPWKKNRRIFKHWIAFGRCSRAIWIASERKANWMHRVLRGAWKFAFLSDSIHMAREHRQNAIQYLYLHLFTTTFVAILLTLTQKCHISKVQTYKKVRHLEQPAPDGWRTEQSRGEIKCK